MVSLYKIPNLKTDKLLYLLSVSPLSINLVGLGYRVET